MDGIEGSRAGLRFHLGWRGLTGGIQPSSCTGWSWSKTFTHGHHPCKPPGMPGSTFQVCPIAVVHSLIKVSTFC